MGLNSDYFNGKVMKIRHVGKNQLEQKQELMLEVRGAAGVRPERPQHVLNRRWMVLTWRTAGEKNNPGLF